MRILLLFGISLAGSAIAFATPQDSAKYLAPREPVPIPVSDHVAGRDGNDDECWDEGKRNACKSRGSGWGCDEKCNCVPPPWTCKDNSKWEQCYKKGKDCGKCPRSRSLENAAYMPRLHM
jgi:hypothetical protein